MLKIKKISKDGSLKSKDGSLKEIKGKRTSIMLKADDARKNSISSPMTPLQLIEADPSEHLETTSKREEDSSKLGGESEDPRKDFKVDDIVNEFDG